MKRFVDEEDPRDGLRVLRERIKACRGRGGIEQPTANLWITQGKWIFPSLIPVTRVGEVPKLSTDFSSMRPSDHGP
ncbi:hypothetical protein STTU_2894 [Streptomyces sp. Tu6071]|nr:hypothetical protein STTU_2894 [Streptomyces sp. Tu6071]